MVITVAQINPSITLKQDVFFVNNRIDHFPVRPDGSAQQQKVTFEIVQHMNMFMLRPVDDLIIDVRQAIAELLDDWKVVIENCIDQCIT